jgi:hypothetical protein
MDHVDPLNTLSTTLRHSSSISSNTFLMKQSDPLPQRGSVIRTFGECSTDRTDLAWLAVWDWHIATSIPDSQGSLLAHIAGYTLTFTQTEEGVALEAHPKDGEALLAKLSLVSAEPLSSQTSISLYQDLPVYLSTPSGPRPLEELVQFESSLTTAFGYSPLLASSPPSAESPQGSSENLSPWIVQYYLYRASQLTPTVEFPASSHEPVSGETLTAFKSLELRQLID